jgi:hypothetical protein
MILALCGLQVGFGFVRARVAVANQLGKIFQKCFKFLQEIFCNSSRDDESAAAR